jgi:hypothetical protein
MQPEDHRRPRDASPEAGEPARRRLRARPVAESLGVGVGTLNKLRTHGGGPRHAKPLPGAAAYDDVADLGAWASERKVRSTAGRARAA